MKLKIGDLVKRLVLPRAWQGDGAGLVVDTGHAWRGAVVFEDHRSGAMQQFVTVLWSSQTNTSFEWSDRLERFDPQSTKEYNAN